MRRRGDYVVDGGSGGEPDALDWDLDINLELELRDDQQSRLYRYLSEGHRPRYRNEPPRRAATVTLANRSVRQPSRQTEFCAFQLQGSVAHFKYSGRKNLLSRFKGILHHSFCR